MDTKTEKINTDWERFGKIEGELNRSLSLLQATLESTADGILVVDTEGRIVSFNRQFVQMWGIPDSIIESRDDRSALQFVLDQLNDPDDFLSKVRELYGKPDAESSDVLRFKDGRVFERYSKPQRVDESVVGRVWSFRDVTIRERTERALRDSEAKYRTLIEHTYDLIAEASVEGRFLFVTPNHEKLLGYAPDELLDQNIFELIHPEDRSGAAAEFSRVLRDFSSGNAVFRSLHKNGEWRWLESSGEPFMTAEGEVRVVIASRDITERKRAEYVLNESLAQLSKKSRYESIVSAITRSVHRSIDLPDVLENAVEAMSTHISQADIVEIYRIEEKETILKAHRGYTNNYIEEAGRIPYPKGFIWKTALDKKPIYCADVDQDKIIGSAGRRAGIRSYLAMPICFEDSTFGVIGINSFQKNSFDDQELKLLEIVSQQIQIAISNARQADALLRSEKALRESLSQLSKKNRYETIIGKVTRNVHRSIDIEEVLENAVSVMSENIEGAENIGIWLVEGQEAVIKAYRGFPTWFVERLSRVPYPKGATWKTVIEGKPTYSGKADEDKILGSAGKELGTKSYLSMPIQSDGKTVGVININSLRNDAFDEDELNLLEIVSHQIQAAINNARQAEALRKSEDALKETVLQLRKRNRYETIISTVTRSVHQSTDLLDVMENAVHAISDNIEKADSVSVYLVEGEEAILKSQVGYSDWYVERVRRIPYPRGYAWKVIMEEQPRYCADVDQDTVIGPAGREFGIKSYFSMPIQFEGKTVGILNVNSFGKNAFDDGEQKLLEIVREQITVALGNARHKGALQEALKEVEKLRDRIRSDGYEYLDGGTGYVFDGIIGRSATLQRALLKAEHAAVSDSAVPILITGEPGTGKELLVVGIHSMSSRKNMPFLRVDLSSLLKEQIEGELFGREEKGEFTGALSIVPGRLELATGGTLYLINILNIPTDIQFKLVRFFKEGVFERENGTRSLKADVRVIASTTQDPKQALESGSLLEELYREFNSFSITLPPLRERSEDIPLLVWHFLRRYADRTGKKIESVSAEAMDVLQSHKWYGNIEELDRVIENSIALCGDHVSELDVKHFSF